MDHWINRSSVVGAGELERKRKAGGIAHGELAERWIRAADHQERLRKQNDSICDKQSEMKRQEQMKQCTCGD